MKCNVGNADRGIRIVIGLSILIAGYVSANLWGFVGLIPLATAGIKWCPLYLPFKINTCKRQQRELS